VQEKPSVLIVDDDRADLTGLERDLAPLGLRLLTLQDGHQLLDRVRAERPDLVLLDALLPGLSGFDLCKQIKTSADGKNILVVILTGVYVKDQYRQDAMRQFKADGFVTKPYRPPELHRLLVRLLSKKLRTTPSELRQMLREKTPSTPATEAAEVPEEPRGWLARFFGRKKPVEPPPESAESLESAQSDAAAVTSPPEPPAEPSEADSEPAPEETPPALASTPLDEGDTEEEAREVDESEPAQGAREEEAASPPLQASEQPVFVESAPPPAVQKPTEAPASLEQSPVPESALPSPSATQESLLEGFAPVDPPPRPPAEPEGAVEPGAEENAEVAQAEPVSEVSASDEREEVMPVGETAPLPPPMEPEPPPPEPAAPSAEPSAPSAPPSPEPQAALAPPGLEEPPPPREKKTATPLPARLEPQPAVSEEIHQKLTEAQHAIFGDIFKPEPRPPATPEKPPAPPDVPAPATRSVAVAPPRPFFVSVQPGLPIYREEAFFSELKREISRCRRAGKPLTLLLIRVDDLSQIAELFGQESKSHVLQHVAELAVETARDVDMAGLLVSMELVGLTAFASDRYGGGRIAARILRAATRRPFVVAEGLPPIIPALRFGMSTFPTDTQELEDLLFRARDEIASSTPKKA
jgi:CheY-like chemotaxis protein